MKTAPADRLKEIGTATSEMTLQQSLNFDSLLIGALSVTASEEAWKSAVETAIKLSKDMNRIEVEATA